mgnify:FL=1
MLFSSSPVKKISEKIKPISESGKRKVSRLKFDRKSDYKTFLDFIKRNTKDLEEQQVKKEKTSNKGAFGLIGLGILGGAFGGGKTDDNAIKTSFISKAIQRAKLNAESEAKKRKDASSTTTLFSAAKTFFKLKVKPEAPIVNQQSSATTNQRKYRVIKKKRIASKQKQLVAAGGIDSKNQKLLPSRAKSLQEKKIEVITKRAQTSEGGKLNKSDLAKILGLDESKLDQTTKIDAEIEQSKIKKDGFFKKTRQNLTKNRQLNIPGFKNVSNIGDIIGTDIETPPNVKRQITDQVLNETYLGRKRDARNVFGSLGLDTPGGLKNKIKLNQFIDDLEARTLAEDIEYEETKQKRLKNIKKIRSEKMLNKNLNKITNFSNRVLNSPVGKFTTFMSGLLASPKVEIIKQLFTATPLADGTLKGKPGVIPAAEELMFNQDAAVNIFNFSEERKSAIPFDANIKAPLVSSPTDLPTPTNNVFVDFEFDATENLFFMKMAGS